MNVIRLRPTVDADRPEFVRLVSQTMNPLIKRSVPHAAEDMVATYWKTRKVSRTIVSTANGAFCGYCNLRFEEPERPEIGIELIESCRGRGIGPLALRMLIEEQQGRHGVNWYRAVVAGNNHASVAMMRKLNAVPDGMCLTPWLDDELAHTIEERHEGNVDDAMRATADWFGVDPTKLLTHRLLFRVPAKIK